MKYVTYEQGGFRKVGLLENDEIMDVAFDGDMVAFIDEGAPIGKLTPVKGAKLCAPLRPRTMRDFLSFEGHLLNAFKNLGKEIPPEWYEVPAYYKGLPDTVIGPEEVVPWPFYSEQLDFELELAAVIGRKGRNISAGVASEHIFGYTIWNDMSARDVQRRELPIGMGPSKAKDWDGSNVLGPCIVTPDEIDIASTVLSVRINGELWGSDTTANMHHSFASMIEYASKDLTLWPGEIFGSGTAATGSGLEMDRWLEPGDIIEMEAGGLGVLRNRVGPHDPGPELK
ncbi:MAG: fumarylacetoacetate hydrolase [Acidimicrobiaceae bacterium]|nr:fumarylacetoacetate hydrolase [Acidimicrobiaceae bacterium]